MAGLLVLAIPTLAAGQLWAIAYPHDPPQGQTENLRTPCFASNCLIELFAARPAGLRSADRMRPAVCRYSFLPSVMRKAHRPLFELKEHRFHLRTVDLEMVRRVVANHSQYVAVDLQETLPATESDRVSWDSHLGCHGAKPIGIATGVRTQVGTTERPSMRHYRTTRSG
ncbi:MAG: hypothetical protein QOJ62_868, partial [Actinomycetota bacterium]|nr:hypothetical protein [Actinomycetota bacterium]